MPGAPEPDPPPDRLPGPPDPLPDRHAEPVTAPLWKKFARWVLRLAFKKRAWSHLGQHLKTLKALGLGAAPGASRRRGGALRVGSGLTSHHPPPITAPYAVRMLPTGVGAGIPRKKLERRRGQGPRHDGRQHQESDEAGERFGTGDAIAVCARPPRAGLRRFFRGNYLERPFKWKASQRRADSPKQIPPLSLDARAYMNTQPFGVCLAGPAFMTKRKNGRPQADRLCASSRFFL